MDLQKKQGMSYIFIGHDLAVVKNISHRIIVMYLGQIVEVIDSDKLTTESVHPYTKALLASVFSVNRKKSLRSLPYIRRIERLSSPLHHDLVKLLKHYLWYRKS